MIFLSAGLKYQDKIIKTVCMNGPISPFMLSSPLAKCEIKAPVITKKKPA